MSFSVDKDKVWYIIMTTLIRYSVNGSELVKVNLGKDLGVIITSDLKLSKHCPEVVKISNKVIGFIVRTF